MSATLKAVSDARCPPPSDVNRDCSRFLDRLISRCLVREPERRWKSMTQLRELLEAGTLGAIQTAEEDLLAAGFRQRRLEGDRWAPVIGREKELDELTEQIKLSLDGKGSDVIVVEGEKGIGKSRLVDAALERLEEDGVAYALCATVCRARARGEFNAWRDFFFQLAECEDDGDAARMEKLGEFLHPLISGRRAPIKAILNFLLTGEPPQKRMWGISGGLTLENLPEALGLMLAALAEDKKIIGVIDDLHFAGTGTAESFAEIAEQLSDSPFALIVTGNAGSGASGKAPGTPSGRRLVKALTSSKSPAHVTRLKRLNREWIARLFHTLRIEGHGRARLMERLYVIGGGNPGITVEYLRTLISEGHLAEGENRIVTLTPVERLPFPEQICRQEIAEFDNLKDHQKEILRFAAVIGFNFRPSLVQRGLDSYALGLERELSILSEKGLLVPGEVEEYHFAHEIFHEYLLQSLDEDTARGFHNLIANILLLEQGLLKITDYQRLQPSFPRELAATLCRHLTGAARPDEARWFLPMAVEHLRTDKQDIRAATDLLREFREERGAWVAGAERNLNTASLKEEILCALDQGQGERLGRLLQLWEKLLGDQADPEGMRSLWLARARHHYRVGETGESARWALEVLKSGEATGDRSCQALAHAALGRVYMTTGDFEKADKSLFVAKEIMLMQGMETTSAPVRCDLGRAKLALGKPQEAALHFEEALMQSISAERKRDESTLRCAMAELQFARGRLPEARESLDKAYDLAELAGLSDLTARTRFLVTVASWLGGARRDVEEELTDSFKDVGDFSSRRFKTRAAGLAAWLYLLAGDAGAARMLIQPYLGNGSTERATPLRGWLSALYAHALVLSGDAARGVEILEQLFESRVPLSWEDARRAEAYLGLALVKAGREKKGLQKIREANAELREKGLKGWLLESLAILGEALTEAGQIRERESLEGSIRTLRSDSGMSVIRVRES